MHPDLRKLYELQIITDKIYRVRGKNITVFETKKKARVWALGYLKLNRLKYKISTGKTENQGWIT